VTQTLVRSSLVMFFRRAVRLIYSPFYPWLRKLLGPLEDGFTKNPRTPPALRIVAGEQNHKDDKNGNAKKDGEDDRA